MARQIEPDFPTDADLLDIFRNLGLEFWAEMGNFRFCPTGEPYWTVCSEGFKAEGALAKLYETKIAAFRAFENVVEYIAGEVKGKKYVFWRKMPEFRHFDDPSDLQDRGWTVYSRFRISSKPVIQSADWHRVSDVPAAEADNL